MNSQEKQQLRAAKHYVYYPEEGNIPTYLAYGFRPVFLLLAPYMLVTILLWGLVWTGVIRLPFLNDILTWHIYELLFGVLTAGTMAFFTTGLPELFPGMVPLVGRRLWFLLLLWVAGRVSFWTIDYTGLLLTAILNLAMLAWVIWYARDALLDKLQRHASLAYTLLVLFGIEAWFFAAKGGLVATSGFKILKVALGAIVVLILFTLRRVNMEAINGIMEDEEIDDVYIARPPSTNLAVFAVTVFTIVEFFFPNNSTLGWLGLAAGASILGITSDYLLKDESILHLPYVWYLSSIFFMLGIGYGLMGWDLLNPSIDGLNHFRHFVTVGGVGLSYLMIMLIVSQVHTGRILKASISTHLMVLFLLLAAVLRGGIPFFPAYSKGLYFWSSIAWTLPFILYIKTCFRYLWTPRADGIAG